LKDEIEELVGRSLADAVIVTGAATGQETATSDLLAAKQASGATPVFAGSGVAAGNIEQVLKIADGAIVGTAFKQDGVTTNPVDPQRVRTFMEVVRRLL
jgi:predicted TIM-barrel enzyme